MHSNSHLYLHSEICIKLSGIHESMWPLFCFHIYVMNIHSLGSCCQTTLEEKSSFNIWIAFDFHTMKEPPMAQLAHAGTQTSKTDSNPAWDMSVLAEIQIGACLSWLKSRLGHVCLG